MFPSPVHAVTDTVQWSEVIAAVPSSGVVWIALRRKGKLLQGDWHEGRSASRIILDLLATESGQTADAVELCITQDRRLVESGDLARTFSNNARGVLGIEIIWQGRANRIAPTTMITSNRSFERALLRLALAKGTSLERLLAGAEFHALEMRQFILQLGDSPRLTELFRGAAPVEPAEVGPGLLDLTLKGLANWMWNNLHPDGRMTYKYWPSRGVEATSNNTVRQAMATLALGRLAASSGVPEQAERVRNNLAWLLDRFYADIDGKGAIILDGKAKLGASAMAALAILEFRNAGLLAGDAHESHFEGLCRGIDALWSEDGSFRSFLIPADRNDNQNFYPGEALLFWASLHRKTRDAALAERCVKSFRWYRDWHLRDPNPAFIPWHSQALTMLHEDLGIEEMASFVLDRNDWLLGMQQWGNAPSPDLRGRFYNPLRPDFGPPHASATGVYMEGLVDAWRLATKRGERRRAESYALALKRGLRAVRQLQYRDPELDYWYVQRRQRVAGGLRTEAYNNEIRVDNVQHCLLALSRLAQESGFDWSDIA